jgi:hypothetical protein
MFAIVKKQKKIFVFLLFLVLNYFWRKFSFSYSTIDWDEITYFIMGQGILLGKIPFVDLWDLKPVGSYLIYALSILLLGYDTLTIRIVSWISVSLISFLVFLILNRKGSLAVSIVFGVLVSVFFVHLASGLSGNTELLFLPFQLSGFLLLSEDSRSKNYLGFLLLGYSFIVKYIIVFDVALFILYYLYINYKRMNNPKPSVGFLLDLIWKSRAMFFFLIPFFLVSIFYLTIGEWEAYWKVTYSVARFHQKSASLNERFSFLLGVYQLFLIPIILSVGLLLWRGRVKQVFEKENILYFLWIVSASLGAVWTGFLYEHYLLGILPPLVLLTGNLISEMKILFDTLISDHKYGRYVIPLASLLILVYFGNKRSKQWEKTLAQIPDVSREIAKSIQDSKPGKLFVASGLHASYVILGQISPTKYVQPNNYQEAVFSKNFKIDAKEVLEEVFKEDIAYIQWCGEEIDKVKTDNINKSVDNNDYIVRLKDRIYDFEVLSKCSNSCLVYKKKELE